MLPTAVLFSALIIPAAETKDTYARPELLVEPGDVAKLMANTKVRLLDARGKGPYQNGHIPKAVWVGATTWARAFGEGKDTDGWRGRIGALGISPDATVIVYDDNLARDAARVWWILRYWGIRDVRLVNGGWKGWQALELETEKDSIAPQATTPNLEPQTQRLALKTALLETIKGNGPQILDARSEGEYCGTEDTAKRNGAIPGALNLEWNTALDKKTGRFKPAGELIRLFKEAGIDPLKPVIAHCQSGGRSSVSVFSLELLGAKDARNYYKSWAEWGNADETPIVKPMPKKK